MPENVKQKLAGSLWIEMSSCNIETVLNFWPTLKALARSASVSVLDSRLSYLLTLYETGKRR